MLKIFESTACRLLSLLCAFILISASESRAQQVTDGDRNQGRLQQQYAEPQAPACSDGKDNDGDGKIDYPADPGCSGPDDNDEKDPPASPVVPYLECVHNLGNGQYRAYFGYDNTGSAPVQITAGTNDANAVNAFSTGQANRGQVSTFAPGRKVAAFSVLFDGNTIEWRVKPANGELKKVIANKSCIACKQIEPEAQCVDKKPGGKYEALFGYKNPNPFEMKVEIGEANKFTPAPQDRGQPTGFFPGTLKSVFAVTYEGSEIKWSLAGKDAVAKESLPRCTVNKPPKCSAGKIGYTSKCQGTSTNIFLDGTGSTDDDGHALKYKWSTDCAGATLSNPASSKPTLTINTSSGASLSCKVTLAVSDDTEETTCSQTVAVEACDLDCSGAAYGGAQVDQCGVCNGNNACLDCAGVPFGTSKVDQCGVCGGNDECTDCKGVPNGPATLDRCGVCEGNGDGCLGCTDSDITNLLFALDSAALAQRNLVRNAAKRIDRFEISDVTRRLITEAVKEAESLYVRAWNSAWSIPRLINNCTNTSICTESDNSGFITSYNNDSTALRDLALKLAREYRNMKRKGIRGVGGLHDNRITRRANALHDINLVTSASVPRFNSICN